MSSNPEWQIRADFDRESIVVYQAFRANIAAPAVEHQSFQPPFSFHRMTWIKPSFLWLMARSQWAQKSGQEHILAIRISREGWEEALSMATLTSPESRVYNNHQTWADEFAQAKVHVQWDPERSIRGAKLPHHSIQVGISRHLIRTYVDEWILSIEDITPLVRKLHKQCQAGQHQRARKQLPPERSYPLPEDIAQHIGCG